MFHIQESRATQWLPRLALVTGLGLVGFSFAGLAAPAALAVPAVSVASVAPASVGVASALGVASASGADNRMVRSVPVTVIDTTRVLARGLTVDAGSSKVAVKASPAVSTASVAAPVTRMAAPDVTTLAFTLPAEERTFVTNSQVLPKSVEAVRRAMSYVGRAELPCPDDRTCYQRCDSLAADIWGYADSSGYASASTHWAAAVSSGIAHPGNRTPPLGALLFYSTGAPEGHVATYVGGGMTVSNVSAGPKGANVYLVSADYFTGAYGAQYLGWAEPVFHGGTPGAAL